MIRAAISVLDTFFRAIANLLRVIAWVLDPVCPPPWARCTRTPPIPRSKTHYSNRP